MPKKKTMPARAKTRSPAAKTGRKKAPPAITTKAGKKKPGPGAIAKSRKAAKPGRAKSPGLEFKIVQTVESGPDAEGKGCIGDRMADEATALAQHGWRLVAAHRSDSMRFKLTFMVGMFRRSASDVAAGKKTGKSKTAYKCKEYRPDQGPGLKPDDFLSKIYADASRMADKGWELAAFFLTEDGAMTGIYRSEKA